MPCTGPPSARPECWRPLVEHLRSEPAGPVAVGVFQALPGGGTELTSKCCPWLLVADVSLPWSHVLELCLPWGLDLQSSRVLGVHFPQPLVVTHCWYWAWEGETGRLWTYSC